MTAFRGTLARCRVRMLRSWWTLALPACAVGFLALWHFCDGWVAAVGAMGCLLSLVVLLMVATIGGSRVMDGEEESDAVPTAEGGDDD